MHKFNNMLTVSTNKQYVQSIISSILLEMDLGKELYNAKLNLDTIKNKYNNELLLKFSSIPKIKKYIISIYFWSGLLTLVILGITTYEELDFLFEVLTQSDELSYKQKVHLIKLVCGTIKEVLLSSIPSVISLKWDEIRDILNYVKENTSIKKINKNYNY